MYLGIDVGTSGVKASVVNVKGQIVSSAYRRFRMIATGEGFRELDPAEMEEGAWAVLAEAMAGSRAASIDLILVTALGEAVIPVDKHGRALTRCIVGTDCRGADELEEIRSRLGSERLTGITGLNLSAIYSLNKILYIRKHHPGIYERTWKFMCVSDYLVYRMTGEAAIDYSMASRTMAFSIEAKSWSSEILSAVGVDGGLFSRPVLAGTVVGQVSTGIAEKTGIGANTPVAIGPHDHICNAIGVGAVKAGDCSNAVGTTEGLTAMLSGRLADKVIARENISCEPFVEDGRYNTVAWHNAAGALVNWYVDMFHPEMTKMGRVEEILKELNSGCTDGPGKLLVIPHFLGATAGMMDEQAKGAILGMTMGTRREDIFKGLIEGACYECRIILDALLQGGVAIDRVMVSGGGSKSPFWLQAKADILGRQIMAVESGDTGALGAGMLAAVACGEYDGIETAAAEMLKGWRCVEPSQENARTYGERYLEYRELRSSLQPVNHLL